MESRPSRLQPFTSSQYRIKTRAELFLSWDSLRMSLSTMVESFDHPMADYSEDIDVTMIGSTSENWYNSSIIHMEEDPILGGNLDPLEVDMMAYEETTEYEMRDEIETIQEVATEVNVVDSEVLDVTIDSSPLPSVHHELVNQDDLHSNTQELIHEDVGFTFADPEPSGAQPNEEAVLSSVPHQPTTSEDQSIISVAESYEPAVVARETTEHVNSSYELDTSNIIPLPTESSGLEVSEVSEIYETAHEHTHEHPQVLPEEQAPDGVTDEDEHEEAQIAHEDVPEVQHEVAEAEEHSEHPNASHILDNNEETEVDLSTHQDPTQSSFTFQPPPISLTLQVTSSEGAQPDFMLFGAPDSGPSDSSYEEPLILLQHHTSLFSEPISNVFHAFRQEEYFSHIEELSKSEMALNAIDLQLVISEDNIYAREVSLYDLYAMHQGIGLPGHLRLTLQSVVPRFIARYNYLRDQITRLTINDESGHQDAVEDTQDENEDIKNEVLPDNDFGHENEKQEDTADEEHQEYAEGEQEDKKTGDHEEQDGEAPEPEINRGDIEQDLLDEEAHRAENDDDTNHPTEDAAEGEVTHDVYEDEDEDEISTEYVDIIEPTDEEEQNSSEVNGDEEDTIPIEGEEKDEEGATLPVEEVDEGSNAEDTGAEEIDENREPYTAENRTSLDVSSHALTSKASEDDFDQSSTLADTENHADFSTQSLLAGTTGEEGNVDDEDDFGEDDFGDDEFDGTEDTFEDPLEEEHREDGDDTSKSDAEDLKNAAFSDFDDIGADTLGDENQSISASKDPLIDLTNGYGDNAISEPIQPMHKKSKRSLDDADLSDQGELSPPSSPGSKRVRVE